MQRIFVYISSLIICTLIVNVNAQKVKKADNTNQIPFFNGLTIQADLASVVGSILSNKESYSYEASAQIDLKHKFYPVIELGYAGANKTGNNNINFITNGLYGLIGVDFNLLNTKNEDKPNSNIFLAGVRLGMSGFPYSISNAIISDDYWGGNSTINYYDKISTKIWYEIVVGMRVEVSKNIFMGWNIRNRNLLNQDTSGDVTPWFIPGYGISSDNNWGISYVIGYKFQLPISTKTSSKNTTKLIKNRNQKKSTN